MKKSLLVVGISVFFVILGNTECVSGKNCQIGTVFCKNGGNFAIQGKLMAHGALEQIYSPKNLCKGCGGIERIEYLSNF